MKRPIKFRRQNPDTGNYQTAMLCHDVDLLVGYDKDGREVYEGDVVVGRDYEIEVKLIPNVVLTNFKLKEASHETTD